MCLGAAVNMRPRTAERVLDEAEWETVCTFCYHTLSWHSPHENIEWTVETHEAARAPCRHANCACECFQKERRSWPEPSKEWPTPTAGNATQGPATTFARGNPTLPNAVSKEVNWPTPTTMDGASGSLNNAGGNTKQWGGNNSVRALVEAIDKGTWPTPTASLGDKGVRSIEGAQAEVARGKGPDLCAVALANWPTPVAHDANNMQVKYAQGGTPLSAAVHQQQNWPTPTETDSSDSARMTCERSGEWKSNAGTTLLDAARLTTAGLPTNKPAPQLAGVGSLNPYWVEILMGFPIGWTSNITFGSGKIFSRERKKRPEEAVPDSNWKQLVIDTSNEPDELASTGEWPGWPSRPGEPQFHFEPPRIAKDIPNRPARLRALGNAVVPQCAEFVGYRLIVIVMTLTGSKTAA